jgi:thiamine biosynthesis lipoprotein
VSGETARPLQAGDSPADSPRGRFRRYEHRALGTWNTILAADVDPARPELAERAAASALGLIDRLEDELSRFRPESDVSLLNALGSDGAVPIGRSLFEVLTLCRAAWEDTEGAFDPTVGPLLDAWGFPRGPARIPPEEEIAALIERRGMDLVVLDPAARTARFLHPGIRLDLGAVGKGYTVDRAAALLRERGVPAGTVNSGNSSIAFWGEPEEGGPWTVQVTHPLEPGESIRTIEAWPGSISTSGAYEDRFVAGGVEYGHILDPRSGRPARSAARSVTVWSPAAARGDALSTALFVLDGEGRARFLERLRGRGERVSALIIEEVPGSEGLLAVLEYHTAEPGFRTVNTER